MKNNRKQQNKNQAVIKDAIPQNRLYQLGSNFGEVIY